MKSFISLVIVFLFAADLCAQSVSDCVGAIQLCEDVYTEANATSTFGNVFEPTGACNNGTETSSMWYTFTVTQSGNDCIVVFTSTTSTTWNAPAGVSTVRYLVVGAGASGETGGVWWR